MELVSLTNRSALNELLLQIFVFVDEVNSVIANRSQGERAIRVAIQTSVFQVGTHYLRSRQKWRPYAALECLDRCAIRPAPPSQALVERLVARMVSPLTVQRDGLQWRVVKSGYGSSVAPPPARITEGLCIYEVSEGYDFATRSLGLRPPVYSAKGIRHTYLDAQLDPFDVISDFLASESSAPATSIYHYVQRWLRDVFGIRHNEPFAFSLERVCRRLNEVFFERPIVSQHQFHGTRPSTIGLELLVDEIRRLLPSGADTVDVERQAVGVLMFLRFNRLLRSRFHWIDDDTGIDTDGLRAVVKRRLSYPKLCFTPLQPIQFSLVKSRVFGSTTGIRGLDFVLSGGLLPYTRRGRTVVLSGPAGSGKTVLALHLAANVAARGQLAVYLSLEESRAALVDRLVMFGLFRRGSYEVLQSDDSLQEQMNQAADRNIGLLVLYGPTGSRHASEFDLETTLGELANRARDRWKGMVLVVDSVNALTVDSATFQEPYIAAQSSTSRVTSTAGELSSFDAYRRPARALVDAIEKNGFTGLVLSEESSSPQWMTLPYLADTVVELGSDGNHLNRWLEITKCRGQYYHPGRHPFRMLEGRGIVVYPSLAAIRSTLRQRGRNNLSEQRMIPLPDDWVPPLQMHGIAEKSCTLIVGASGTGKSLLGLTLATTPAVAGNAERAYEPSDRRASHLSGTVPGNVLLVTFRTPEVRFSQTLKRYRHLERQWFRVPVRQVRWYSPGTDFTGDQFVNEIWRHIESGRSEGVPVERIVFDEIEVAESMLPNVAASELFWPTLMELLATEPVTTFLIASDEHDFGESPLVRTLKTSADYSFQLSHDFANTPPHTVSMTKRAGTWMLSEPKESGMSIDDDGRIMGSGAVSGK